MQPPAEASGKNSSCERIQGWGSGREGFLAEASSEPRSDGGESLTRGVKEGCRVDQVRGARHNRDQWRAHLQFIPRAPRSHEFYLQQ